MGLSSRLTARWSYSTSTSERRARAFRRYPASRHAAWLGQRAALLVPDGRIVLTAQTA
jgi:hypothetical protein